MHCIFAITAAVLLCLIGQAHLACQSQTVDQWVPDNVKLMSLEFGLKDSTNGSAPYVWKVKNSKTSQVYFQKDQQEPAMLNAILFLINQATLIGGLNMTYINYSTIVEFVPTASFICQSDTSAIWGPTYPDYRKNDYDQRRRFQNLQLYLHYSAPRETSYIRQVLFIKNIGSTPERVELLGRFQTDSYAQNISPIDNEGRYFTGFPFQEGDMGFKGTDPASKNSLIVPSVHVEGSRGRDKTGLIGCDFFNLVISPTYRTVVAPGEEIALMYIASFGLNRSLALSNAAEIDTEPAYIFHDLSADQLLMIRNWDGCPAIAVGTSVAIRPSSACSTEHICQFTASVTSTRASTGFTHRVVSSKGIELVAVQSSGSFSVPETADLMTHQLWYKDCLVKETLFNKTGSFEPVPFPVTATPFTEAAPSQIVSDASVLGISSILCVLAFVLF